MPHHRPSIVQLLSCLVGLTLGAQQGLADVYGTPATPGAAVNVNETPGKRPQVLGKMLGECWENRKKHGKMPWKFLELLENDVLFLAGIGWVVVYFFKMVDQIPEF